MRNDRYAVETDIGAGTVPYGIPVVDTENVLSAFALVATSAIFVIASNGIGNSGRVGLRIAVIAHIPMFRLATENCLILIIFLADVIMLTKALANLAVRPYVRIDKTQAVLLTISNVIMGQTKVTCDFRLLICIFLEDLKCK